MTGVKEGIILVFAGLGISLLTAEIILGSSVLRETKRLAVLEKELGRWGISQEEGQYSGSTEGLDVAFRCNGNGSGVKTPSADAPGYQMILPGDLFAESLEGSYEESFQKNVEQELKRSVGPSCAAVNISSKGYSPALELLSCRKSGLVLSP